MARVAAAVRLLWRLTKRDLKSLKTIGLNNLFFCMIFLIAGGSAQQGFASTLLLQIVVLLPMLFAMGAGALERVPVTREALWPLAGWERLVVRVAAVAMNPAFWLVGGLMGLWGGVAAGIGYVLVALCVQVIVFVGSFGAGWSPLRWLPVLPGRLGGIATMGLRQMMRTLDFWAAVLLCAGGVGYRWLAKAPEPEAFPILAMMVAVALSTAAQRMFGLETAGSMARYRLMPLAAWEIVLAKDAAYLAVAAVLVTPLGFGPGITFSLVALAVGRWPSLKEKKRQRAWRFSEGNLRFGVGQVLAGGLMGLGCARLGGWFLVAAAVGWMVSVWAGGRWMESDL